MLDDVGFMLDYPIPWFKSQAWSVSNSSTVQVKPVRDFGGLHV